LLIKVIANSTVNKNDGCVFFINAKALSSWALSYYLYLFVCIDFPKEWNHLGI
jgi:hypothetical protein